MARTYRRDSAGRFSGGGGGGKKGGGGGGKPKTSTARGRARSAESSARAKVKAGGGSKATKSLLTAQRARDYYSATGTGTKRSGTRAASSKATVAKAATKKPAKTSKAAPDAAKAKYKAARSAVRELKMYRGGKSDATVKKAQAKVTRMEKTRKASRARV